MRKFGQQETHIIPVRPEEEKQEVIPVADGGVTTVENTVVAKTEVEINDSEVDPNVVPNDHSTIISPCKKGVFNFIVNCKCYWQGRAVTSTEANKLAKDHIDAHRNDHKLKYSAKK